MHASADAWRGLSCHEEIDPKDEPTNKEVEEMGERQLNEDFLAWLAEQEPDAFVLLAVVVAFATRESVSHSARAAPVRPPC